ERDILRGSALTGILEQREQRQQQQDDDDPEGEIAQIGVHRFSFVVARIAAFVLSDLSLVATRESPPRPHCNLGAARLAAKGTTSDYLAHPEAIPVQKMTLQTAFSEVVKTQGSISPQRTVFFAALRGSLG